MKTEAVKARYMNGAFQLLDEVSFPEGEKMIIHIEIPDAVPSIDVESRECLDAQEKPHYDQPNLSRQNSLMLGEVWLGNGLS